jgi:voltage-gated potassium channel
MKERIFEIVSSPDEPSKLSKAFDIFIICLIVLNVITVIADTFSLPEWARNILWWIEVVSVVIFTLEYLLRIYTADLMFPEMKPFRARLRYIRSFMAVIDLLAILPFYVPYIIPIDLRILRMLRIIRLLRIFKINRYTTALSTIADVFKRKRHELLSSIAVVSMLMIIAAVLMYNIENEAQPEAFENAFAALWWAVATLTTVGYGDVYPVTVLGKILSAIIALLGIGLVAVPTGIISSGFVESMEEKHKAQEEHDKKCFCPYCGKKLK